MLLALTLLAFAIVFIPVWIIQPFKPQTSRGVELSYMLRRWSPWITILALVTVFTHCQRAAGQHPIHALRFE